MRESAYQRRLVRRLESLFPGCTIIKNDPRFIQGVPDLLILFRDRWAMLEVKLADDGNRQPNQAYYVDKFNGMSFASFICPENEESVLSDLQQAFGSVREARIP